MSGSFGIEGGQIKIERDGRTVLTTEGTLVLLEPTEYVTSFALNYPDFQKDVAYYWQFLNDISPNFDRVAMYNGCAVDITAIQQDWSQEDILTAAPEGADFISAMVRITGHPKAPSHDWGGSSIETRIPQGPWLPILGSSLIEAEFGMARTFSLYLSGGNLCIHRQQSVATPAGGYERYGDSGFSPGSPENTSGGQNYFLANTGLPIYRKPETKNSTRDYNIGFGAPRYNDSHRMGESDQCDVSDPTNYATEYDIEIRARFGRRS